MFLSSIKIFLYPYQVTTPKAVIMEDKTSAKQLRLMAQLNKKDKNTGMNIIDTILTKQKFQEFYQQNVAH